MTDATKAPERQLRHKTRSGTGNAPGISSAGSIVAHACARRPDWSMAAPTTCPWPFRAEDTSPLAWWRTLPSGALRDVEHLLLLATLARIRVLHGGEEFVAAMRGDAAAAIGVAFSLMPVAEMTLQVDIVMTTLLRCALERNAAAALVLSQVLGLTDLGHAFAHELAVSWFNNGLRHSAEPAKFSQAGAVLIAAFGERERNGDDA
jgi:hypothetical protein